MLEWWRGSNGTTPITPASFADDSVTLARALPSGPSPPPSSHGPTFLMFISSAGCGRRHFSLYKRGIGENVSMGSPEDIIFLPDGMCRIVPTIRREREVCCIPPLSTSGTRHARSRVFDCDARHIAPTRGSHSSSTIACRPWHTIQCARSKWYSYRSALGPTLYDPAERYTRAHYPILGRASSVESASGSGTGGEGYPPSRDGGDVAGMTSTDFGPF